VATPFDQDFYLILNVAVGGGYFPDNVGGKPWVQEGADKSREFWEARDQWVRLLDYFDEGEGKGL